MSGDAEKGDYMEVRINNWNKRIEGLVEGGGEGEITGFIKGRGLEVVEKRQKGKTLEFGWGGACLNGAN